MGKHLQQPGPEIRAAGLRVEAWAAEKRPDTGYAWEVEQAGLADALSRSKERRLKGDSEVFGLSTWVNSGAFY